MQRYYTPLKAMLPESDLEIIFGDLEIIADLSKLILKKIQERVKQWLLLLL